MSRMRASKPYNPEQMRPFPSLWACGNNGAWGYEASTRKSKFGHHVEWEREVQWKSGSERSYGNWGCKKDSKLFLLKDCSANNPFWRCDAQENRNSGERLYPVCRWRRNSNASFHWMPNWDNFMDSFTLDHKDFWNAFQYYNWLD